MLARLPRPAAILFALLVLALGAWCFSVTPPPIKTAKKGGYTDARLYNDIAAEVAKGRPYHQAAAELHRAHHYPLKPFFTMRPPTEIEIAARIGWPGVQKLCFLMLIAGIFTWAIAHEGRLSGIERFLVGAAVAMGGTSIASARLMALQEYPAGLCMTVALAGVIGWPRQWWYVVPVLGAGLFIRELALPFALLAMLYAGWNRRWVEVGVWAALLAAWGVFMAIHAQLAMAQWLPGDIQSQGWHAMQGFSGFLKAVIYTTLLQRLPLHWALLAASLPLVGWLALGGREGIFANLLVWGYAIMIAIFSRADTFYWGAIMAPWYMVGYALLPRALVQLYWAIKGQRRGEVPPLPQQHNQLAGLIVLV